MYDITVKGLDSVRRAFMAAPKQVRAAEVLALSRIAMRTHKALTMEMSSAFDRPTPYTLRGLAWLSAKPQNLHASVFARQFAGKGTPAERYLQPQVYGGERKLKRFEKALQGKGLMPKGWIAIPGPGARLDAYGNMSRGQIVQILSALKAFNETGYLANRTSSKRSRRKVSASNYFVPKKKPGAPPVGIYRHLGGRRNIPVILFKPSAHYSKRYRFHEVGNATVAKIYQEEFDRAMRFALANAFKV